MDRFNTIKIFERLREINTLINIHKKGNNVLRFFYLLRDDVFVSKDRTKFFDYIIPVVPVVDSSNSYDQFISHLKNGGLFEKFNESFLQGLSLYIDDMRILKNIYNEFVIYYNKLNTIDLNCNKMLAIIAYKNLFPSDFADLQLNKGFVYTLFNSKNDFIENEIKSLQNFISQRQNHIDKLKSEHFDTIEELSVVFAHKYLNNYNWEHKQGDELNDFVTNYLNEDRIKEYLSRKQGIDYKKDEKIFELLSAVILSMALIVGCGSSKSDDELVVYFVPSRDSKEIQSATQPLADMLKEELAKEGFKFKAMLANFVINYI